MDRHVRQRLVTVVLAALVIFDISIFSPVGNGDGLGITTIQAKKRTHQLSGLLGQQIAVLMGLDINPSWTREQSATDSLIYGIVEPDDTVPAGISRDYSYLVTSSHNKKASLFFKADKKKVTIKYANHDERLYTKTVLLSRLVERPYRTKKQRQQANEYTSALRAG